MSDTSLAPEEPIAPPETAAPATGVGTGDFDLYKDVVDEAEYQQMMRALNNVVDRMNGDPAQPQMQIEIDQEAARNGKLDGVKLAPKPLPEEIQAGVDEALANRSIGATTGEMIGTGAADPGVADAIGRGVKDFGKGVLYSPMEVLGGVRDAGQEFIDFASSIESGAVDLSGLKFKPSNQFWAMAKMAMDLAQDPKNFEGAAKNFADNLMAEPTQLPDVPESGTVTGQGIRKISQFLTGMAAGSKGLSMMGLSKEGLKATPAILRTMLTGAISDFAFMDENEGNLMNLAKEFGVEAPVVDFLASNPDDPAVVNRLRNALVGSGFGVLTDGMVGALRMFGKARQAKTALQTQMQNTAKQNVIASAMEAKPGEMVPMVETQDMIAQRLAGKIDDAMRRTNPGVPDEVLARSLTDEVMSSPGSGKMLVGPSKFVVNLDRINTPEDFRKMVGEFTTAFAGDINKARGGPTRTWAEVRGAAGDEDPWEILANQRTGKPLSDVETTALRELHYGMLNRVKYLRDAVIKDGGHNPLLAGEFRQSVALFEMVNEHVRGAAAEAGRALGVWRMISGLNGASTAKAVQKALDEAGGNATSLDLALMLRDAEMIGGSPGVVKMAEKGAWAKTRDALTEWFYFSILSGPKTHIRNILGSASAIAMDMSSDIISKRLAKLVGDDKTAELIGDTASVIHGMKTSFWDALFSAGRAIRHGEGVGEGADKLGDVYRGRTSAISGEAFGLSPNNPLSYILWPVGKLAQGSGRLLSAEDRFFSTLISGGEIARRASLKAREEIAQGLTMGMDNSAARIKALIANPTKDMLAGAAEKAKYLTFRSPPGKFMALSNRLRHEYPTLRFVVPFMNTVGNLMKFGVEYSPLAPSMKKFRDAIKQGGPEAYAAKSKALMGTFLVGLGMDLAFAGQLTGPGPKNSAERKRLTDMGVKPFSLKVGDQMMYLNHVDPGTTPLMLGATIAEAMMNDNGNLITWQDWEEMISRAGFASAQVALDKTALSGISQLVTAMDDPTRYAQDYIKRFAGSLVVPNFIAHAAQALDPQQRYATTLMEQIQSRIPWYREGLSVVRDNHGRPVNYASDMGAMYDFLSPLYMSQFKPEPIDVEMMKHGIGISRLPKDIEATLGDKGSVRVDLSDYPAELSRYHELIGQTRPSQFAHPPTYPVDRVEVIDGDSFWAVTPDGQRKKYRLAAVNAHELKSKKEGDKAKAELQRATLRSALASGKVSVQPIGLGPHGEVISTVTVDGDIWSSVGGPPTKDVADIIMRVGGQQDRNTKRTRPAVNLINRYGDVTRLEAMNAVVGESDPGGPLGDVWKAWHDAQDPDEKDKIIQKIEDDYRGAAKQIMFIEFPWIEDRLRNPVNDDPELPPVVKRMLEK